MKADRAVITTGNVLLANKYLPSSLAVLILPLMLFVSLRHNLVSLQRGMTQHLKSLPHEKSTFRHLVFAADFILIRLPVCADSRIRAQRDATPHRCFRAGTENALIR
jgi:hypothetical protein